MPKHSAPAKLLRVIRDSRDATKDYYLRPDRVAVLYAQGKLLYDLTSEAYCHREADSNQPKFS